MISLDIVLAKRQTDRHSLHNFTSDVTVQFWLECIRARKVGGFIAGPPCETWTAAKWIDFDDAPSPQKRVSKNSHWKRISMNRVPNAGHAEARRCDSLGSSQGMING